MNPASELASGIAQEATPAGMSGFAGLDPATLIQLLQRLVGGGQPQWARGGAPTDPGGSAMPPQQPQPGLKGRMVY